ncbi:MAG: UDP-N-acetylglucosamine 4,6-dehydratase, partial [Pedobacter sp.]
LHLITFAAIAVKYLEHLAYEPHLCKDEDEARNKAEELIKQKKWPCLFTASDTTGEKDFEEFFTEAETLDMDRFQNLGVIKNPLNVDESKLELFTQTISSLKLQRNWKKEDLLSLFHTMIPDFGHQETGKYLDAKM